MTEDNVVHSGRTRTVHQLDEEKVQAQKSGPLVLLSQFCTLIQALLSGILLVAKRKALYFARIEMKLPVGTQSSVLPSCPW